MTGAAQHARRTVLFSGTVQGVGFRYTARRIARQFQVTGYVRNLPDGRVELVAEGTPDEIGPFLAALEAQMADCIRDRSVTEAPATGEFAGFAIAF